MNMLAVLVALSIVAQAVAAVWVLTLIRLSGRAFVWVALASVLMLMLARRVLALVHESGIVPQEAIHTLSEVVGATVSLLMILVVYGLRRLFVERRWTQTTLRLSQEMFDRLTAAAQDAIVMLGPDGRIAFWNAAAERIFGYRAPEAVGRMLHELIVPERLREGAEKGMANFCQTGQGPILGKVQELPSLRKDGTEFVAEHSIAALKLEDGWYAIGIARDVSERKEAQRRLEEQLDELRRFERIAVGRELRIKELRDEVQSLREKPTAPERSR